ncbi:ribonuclease Z, partial [candidate division KSB1 bacterium]|nr:ribonuclease Z [candidate division KSB1 bacterium]
RRRLPALVIQHKGELVLCDCGEGTQMWLPQAGLSAAKISTIIISHLHGDHIFGLPGFLTTQTMLGRNTALSVYGPAGTKKYMEMIQDISGFEIHYPLEIVELEKDGTRFSAAGFDITARLLDHRITCFGYRFHEPAKPGKFNTEKADQLHIPSGPLRAQLQQGNSIIIGDRTITPAEVMGPERPGRIVTFCTDTRPTPNAIELARNGNVLIHDSTFGDDHADWAVQTFHSTSREAGEIARQSNCRQLLLWHISNRYDEEQEKILLQQAQNVFPNTMLGRDFLEIQIHRQKS